jgi:hypothetical protein
MKDTSEKVKQIQLSIWLKKSLAERLLQTLKDNEDLYVFYSKTKLVIK